MLSPVRLAGGQAVAHRTHLARLYPFWSSRAESNVPDLSFGRGSVTQLEREQTAENRASGSVALGSSKRCHGPPQLSQASKTRGGLAGGMRNASLLPSLRLMLDGDPYNQQIVIMK